MNVNLKMRYLKIALVLIGLFFIIGLYPMMLFLPSSWGWIPPQPEYEQMIIGVYATLGVFLLLAVKNPMNHLSLLWFAVWSSIVHGAIMLVQAINDPLEYPNLYGDIPGLFLVAIVLAILIPGKEKK